MKIALVSEYYYPLLGGITEHVHNLALSLHRRGHEVTVVTHKIRPRPGHHYPDEPIPFRVVRFGRGLPIFSNGSFARITVSPTLASDLRRFFARERFDVIHAHSPLTPTLPVVAVRNSDAPVTVGTFHTYFDPRLSLSVLRRQAARHLEMLDARIAVSEACIEALERYFHCDYEVIPNGVDPGCFHPEAAPAPVMQGEDLNILFVGRFDPRNGLRTMLEAFRLVKEEFPACRLTVVGDGPLRPYYRALAARYGGGDVYFAGLVNGGRPGYYAAADVFCIPCSKASFGVVLLEAMAAGIPIVASDINGYRTVMEDGREGLMVPPGSPPAFARALLRLLRDADLRRRMGAAGRQKALSTYSWDSVSARVEALYRRLLYGEPGSPPEEQPVADEEPRPLTLVT